MAPTVELRARSNASEGENTERADHRSLIRSDGPCRREEACALPLTHGITVYPFLWSQEAQHDLTATTRSPAAMAELFSLQDEFAVRFGAEPDTSTLTIRTD